MNDTAIRTALLIGLNREYRNDLDTLIIEELGLCQGEARIDIAVVNGCIHGYEIKSDQDTLKRLSRQAAIYSRVLDRVTLVVSGGHLDEALPAIPDWWGVLVAMKRKGRICFVQERKTHKNPHLDPFALVQLLWRDEAYKALKERNLHTGLTKKARVGLWEVLSEQVPLAELTRLVRETLKLRQSWRFA